MAHGTSPGEPSRWLNDHLNADPTDACVEWPYTRNSGGYGRILDGGRQRMVTHIVLEQAGLPRPPAPRNLALHSCHNPPCVNRRHLRWGTQKDNIRDMRAAGRQSSHEQHARRLTTPSVSSTRRAVSHSATSLMSSESASS